MTLVAVDLETTGLNPDRDLIAEVAVVVFTEAGTVLAEWATLVRAIPLDAHGYPADPLTRVHRIPPAALLAAPRWRHIAHRVAHVLEGATVVGHNVRAFDLPFLAAACGRVGRAFTPAGVIDTLERDRRSRHTLGRHRLADACAAWGLPAPSHRALPDARAAAALATRQAALLGWR